MELKSVMRNEFLKIGLTELARDIKNELGDNITLVEIGSYMGESAEIFAQILPNSKIYCIDPFVGNFDAKDPCSYDNYLAVEHYFDLRIAKYGNITKMKGFSTDYSIDCDAVYIDGRHFYEGVKEDILHWMPLIKNGGIISGHDYYEKQHIMYVNNPHIQGVKRAVDEILVKPKKTYSDGSWMKKI